MLQGGPPPGGQPRRQGPPPADCQPNPPTGGLRERMGERGPGWWVWSRVGMALGRLGRPRRGADPVPSQPVSSGLASRSLWCGAAPGRAARRACRPKAPNPWALQQLQGGQLGGPAGPKPPLPSSPNRSAVSGPFDWAVTPQSVSRQRPLRRTIILSASGQSRSCARLLQGGHPSGPACPKAPPAPSPP